MGRCQGMNYSHERHLGTSAPKRAFSFSELVGDRGSIEKCRDLNKERQTVSYGARFEWDTGSTYEGRS